MPTLDQPSTQAVPDSAYSYHRYLGDGKYEPRQYKPGDRIQNPRFVGDRRYPHEKFIVEKVEGEYVFTRNEYSGTRGVMLASFYDGWPMARANP